MLALCTKDHIVTVYSVFHVDKLESYFAIHFGCANLSFANLPPLLTFNGESRFYDNWLFWGVWEAGFTCSLVWVRSVTWSWLNTCSSQLRGQHKRHTKKVHWIGITYSNSAKYVLWQVNLLAVGGIYPTRNMKCMHVFPALLLQWNRCQQQSPNPGFPSQELRYWCRILMRQAWE